MLMMQWNARATVLRLATDHGQRQREREWEREREQEQQEAAAWRGEHVPLALHVVKYGCGQFFQQQQQHQIELIVKEKLAKNFGMLFGGGEGKGTGTNSSCCAHKFRIQSCFYLLRAPFLHLPLSSVLQICATRISVFFLFLFFALPPRFFLRYFPQ